MRRAAVNHLVASSSLARGAQAEKGAGPFCVYVLRSESSGRFYCGITEDLNRRLRQHNDPGYRGSKTTQRFTGPWQIVWSEPAPSRAAAMARERAIKRRGMGRYLDDLQAQRTGESRQRRD